MNGAAKGAEWDFFVSYTQADKAWAEWIAWQLEEAGHRVLVQAWDFVPGVNWVQKMDDGVTRSQRTIAVLSDAYLASVYGRPEWQAAWAADPRGEQGGLVVARVQDCDRPGLLSGVVGVDLFGLPEADTREALLTGIAAALAGRAKPDREPSFPGAAGGPRAVPHGAPFPAALPRAWNVPTRNPAFTGRGGDLTRLAEGLAAAGAVAVHSLRGMGGVGKTQLANEYCHTRRAGYEIVWWVDAEEPAMLADGFMGLAAELGRPTDATDPAAVRAAVHAGLKGAGGWLLVFDNAESLDTIRAWAPTFPLAPGARGHVLVTTRRDGFDALGQVVDLDVLTPQESVTLIRVRVGDLPTDDAERLADELGHLPLALEQAASYLRKSRLPAPDYLDLLRTRTAEMLHRGIVADRADVSMATLWDLSLQRLTAQSLAAVQLLHLCAYLGPDPIPEDLFTAHPELLPEPLAEAARDRLAFTDTLASLLDYALARRTPAGIQVHRLVQAAVRADPTTGSDPLTRALALLAADAPGRIRGEPQHWPRWAVLLPHIMAATSYRTTPQTERDVSWLLDRAGTYLQVHGRPGDARPLLERALTIDEAAYGPDHPEVAPDLNNLALVLQDLGDPDAARPLAERALTITEAAYGPDHPDVATRLGKLVTVLLDLGDPDAARPLAERALTITETVYGPDHPDVATRLGNCAAVLRALGDPDAARPLAERALTITEATHGPDHPQVAIRLNTLAGVLQDLGDPDTARPLLERALIITETAYGPDHPRIATIRAFLDDLG